ncbi:MAG: toll/interleukin-1 receptor domain-containing protein [Cyanothece sp. SIO1E1]|nr:toll/interleukin-1 receptor domain-containing protein [Cyanothece sp. SIO1E1]
MKVFISHASTDTKLAKRIADTLREAGFQVWDYTQILPGENWAESLSKALQNSDAMIVLLTPNSVRSSNIGHDVGYALGQKDYKDRLIPVIAAPDNTLSPTEIPWVLNRFHLIHVPNLEESEEGLQEITQALKAVA